MYVHCISRYIQCIYMYIYMSDKRKIHVDVLEALPTFYFMGLRMLLLLHAIIPYLHTWIVCGSVISELRTTCIYVSSVWSFHNQLFTMHHSGYYLVPLIFGTTIPTSLNILVKCFLHLDTCTCIYLPLFLRAITTFLMHSAITLKKQKKQTRTKEKLHVHQYRILLCTQ